MIRIDRDQVSSPIPSELLQRFLHKCQVFYDVRDGSRAQRRIDIQPEWGRVKGAVQHALLKLFHSKCAYCESSLSTGIEADQFRPVVGAADFDGDTSPDHYGWLALDWDNLYASCAACNRAKRSLFPVATGRADPMTSLEFVRKFERALLIDPCHEDPSQHLVFTADGYVHAADPRGEATIKVLNLNRTALQDSRARVFDTVRALLAAGAPVDALLDDRSVHAAAARAAANILTGGDLRGTYAVPAEKRSPSAVLKSDDEEAFRLTARPVRAVHVRNFKALYDVEVEFPDVAEKSAPWLMLLGVNAAGKSTLLQAIALALAGAREADAITTPATVLTRGEHKGFIALHFWDSDQPVTLHFERGSETFTGTDDPSAIVMAYGALRHPRSRQSRVPPPRFVNVRSLFRSVSAIPHPARWLGNAEAEQFDVAARVLRTILEVGQDTIIMRRGRSVLFQHGRNEFPLAGLSAGFQTVVAVAADIIRLLLERWKGLESATAIVLVDEIDAHLHPRWKMRIVRSLREAFPYVQFIATTHDPLVLRGMRNGEVAVLRRDAQLGTLIDRNLPPIEGMQVDELLTSRHFGLESTLDPEVEALFDEYYYLLSRPSDDPAAASRLSELRARLADTESLGRNRRENALLAVADQFLAAQPPDLDETTLRSDTVARLQQLLDATGLQPRGPRSR